MRGRVHPCPTLCTAGARVGRYALPSSDLYSDRISLLSDMGGVSVARAQDGGDLAEEDPAVAVDESGFGARDLWLTSTVSQTFA